MKRTMTPGFATIPWQVPGWLLVLGLIMTVAWPIKALADDLTVQKAKLTELFQLYTEAGRFRGAALVAVDGDILLADGFGMADETWQIPNTAQTKFPCASLSKQFTATAVLVLAEMGKVELDAPLDIYLPELRSDIAERITLRAILNHTAGLRRELFAEAGDDLQFHDKDQILAEINKTGLRFEPGSKSGYSNVGYVLLRFVVAAVHGTDFPTAVAELVFSPAGMNESGWCDDTTVVANLAAGYDIILGQPVRAEFTNPANIQGASGMYTTVMDLEAFDRALQQGKVLSLDAQRERVTSRAFDWGLGWKLMNVGQDDNDDTIHAVYHNGDYSGVATHYFRYPGEEFVIALLSNQSDLPRTELFNKIAGIVNGGEPSGPKPQLSAEIYEVVVREGEQAGLDYARQAKQDGRRGAPSAMQIIQIGNALSRMGRNEETRRIFAYAALADPDAPWGHLGLGKWYEENGRILAAEECYRAVLANDPDQPHALEYLAALPSQ